VRVVARDVIALRPEALDGSLGWPALEGEGAGFEALDDGIAGEEGFFGEPDCGVEGFVACVVDG